LDLEKLEYEWYNLKKHGIDLGLGRLVAYGYTLHSLPLSTVLGYAFIACMGAKLATSAWWTSLHPSLDHRIIKSALNPKAFLSAIDLGHAPRHSASGRRFANQADREDAKQPSSEPIVCR
jgi:hypothetical protein